MSYLLDTHTFIWFINGDLLLPKKVIDTIKNPNNQCYISIGSLWEIAIKIKLNKLTLNSDFGKILDFIEENEIEVLPITFSHILALNDLDFHHRDPFDRILLAQSAAEQLTIISKDKNFSLYDIRIFW
jgi:PIN domain nuclease of toxin-antitoxin system